MPESASCAGVSAAMLGVDTSSQLAPLTVDFHESGFVATWNVEHAFRAENGFWFQFDDKGKQEAKRPLWRIDPTKHG